MKLKSIFIKIGLILMLFIPLTVWSMGKKEKIDICHNGKVINVSKNALKAHKGHGDFVIESEDDACPATEDDDIDEEEEEDNNGDESNSDNSSISISELNQAIFIGNKLYIPQLEVDVFGSKQIFSVILEFDVLNFGFIVKKIKKVTEPRDDVDNAIFSNNIVNVSFFYDQSQVTINADLELISPNILVVTDFNVVADNSDDTDTDDSTDDNESEDNGSTEEPSDTTS